MAYIPDPIEAALEEKAERFQRRFLLSILVVVVLSLGVVVTLGIFRFQDSATLRGQSVAQDRTDCARKINDERTVLRDGLLGATTDLAVQQADLINAILTPPIDLDLVHFLQSQVAASGLVAHDFKVKLGALPKANVEVAQKCPSV